MKNTSMLKILTTIIAVLAWKSTAVLAVTIDFENSSSLDNIAGIIGLMFVGLAGLAFQRRKFSAENARQGEYDTLRGQVTHTQ